MPPFQARPKYMLLTPGREKEGREFAISKGGHVERFVKKGGNSKKKHCKYTVHNIYYARIVNVVYQHA